MCNVGLVLGAEIPKQPVIAGPFGVGSDSIGVEEKLVPATAVIPFGAPGGDGQVGPPVGDSEQAKVDVPGPAAIVGQQGVGRAGVAVSDDELVDGRDSRGEVQGRGYAQRVMALVPGC
jgi:hypothetical protein